MQELFEKIIEKLDGKRYLNNYESTALNYNKALYDAIEIVKQVAAEYEENESYRYASLLADAVCKHGDDIAEKYEKATSGKTECNNEWIPCSERLPERNKPVLCWVTSTTIAIGETYIIGSCDNGFWFLQTYEIGHRHFPVKDYKVIAWKPLPEPYQSKGE